MRDRLYWKKATNVIVEHSVLRPEHVQVSERVVRRKVLELKEQLREDFLHSIDELLHEGVHLEQNYYILHRSTNSGLTSAVSGRFRRTPR